MKKVKEAIAEHINTLLGSFAVAALAYLATVGYWFCDLLGLNEIYCDPFMIRSEMFLILGALISVVWLAWRRLSSLAGNIAAAVLFSLAVIGAIILPIITRLAPLPRTPEETIEFHRVVPFQIAIGVIVSQILIWIFDYIGPDFKDWLRKKLGLTNSDVT
jgi:hypothetical protein